MEISSFKEGEKMEVFLAQVVNGISLGSIYVLLVTGFNLMLLVARVIQFAYPQFVVLSIYASWAVLNITGNVILSVLAALALSILLNLLSEPIFRRINNIEKVDINASFVASIGISMIIVEIMSHSINDGFPISFPDFWTGGDIFSIGLISLGRGEFYALIGGFILVGIFFYLLYHTHYGRIFRAIAEDRKKARAVGLPVLKASILSYLAAGVLGGVIAVLFSMLLGSASPWLGESVALKVLAVSITAGLGNLKGGLYVGLGLGILESLAIGYLPGSWANVIAFVLMLIIVLVRPEGLFGGSIE